MKTSRLISITATLLGGMIAGAHAETWNGALNPVLDWSNTGNWVEGTAPNGVDAVAASPNGAPHPVLDVPVTIGTFSINASGNATFAIDGPSLLTFDVTTGNGEINVNNKNVNLNADLDLQDDVAVGGSGGGSLRFLGALTGSKQIILNGSTRILSFEGGNISGFSGDVTIDGGTLRSKGLRAEATDPTKSLGIGGTTLTLDNGGRVYHNRDDGNNGHVDADIVLAGPGKFQNDGNRGGCTYSGVISGPGALSIDVGNANRPINFDGTAANTFTGDILAFPVDVANDAFKDVKLLKDGAWGGTSAIELRGTVKLNITEDAAGDGAEDRINDAAALTLRGGNEVKFVNVTGVNGGGNIALRYVFASGNQNTLEFDPTLGPAEVKTRLETDIPEIGVGDVNVTSNGLAVPDLVFTIEFVNNLGGQKVRQMQVNQGSGIVTHLEGNFGRVKLDGAGVNETVSTLFLGQETVVQQAAGTYGSTTSAATFKDDDHFEGDGILTVLNGPSVVGVPDITAIEVLGTGDVVLTLDGAAAGLTVQQSDDLTLSSFSDVASTVTDTNELTIDSSLVDPNMDGADFFRVKN